MSDPDAEMIARLQGAKGLQPRAWLRENKRLALVFGAYLGVVGAIVLTQQIFYPREEIGPYVLFGIFFAPIVMLRIYLRWRRS